MLSKQSIRMSSSPTVFIHLDAPRVPWYSLRSLSEINEIRKEVSWELRKRVNKKQSVLSNILRRLPIHLFKKTHPLKRKSPKPHWLCSIIKHKSYPFFYYYPTNQKVIENVFAPSKHKPQKKRFQSPNFIGLIKKDCLLLKVLPCPL